jgi:hypothetical protein
MPTAVGPNTKGEENLVFGYDLGDVSNSYKGEPTINYIHHNNAVAQDSYTSWSATSAGTWNAKHPKAIRAYNASGGEITGYYNSGVTDAANTYHAHWQYDPILKKPVVVMNDVDGQWKAKSFSTGMGSWNSYGKRYGDTYTISWLQWVDNLSKNAKTGLYSRTTTGSNGFHDGLANSPSSYNTKLYTWQRVYQTYTTSSARDLDSTYLSIYMYGYYNVRATVKIADVQFTWGDHPAQFSAEYERSATEGLLDLTGNSTIDLSNVSFNSNAQMTFDGTSDTITLPDPSVNTDDGFTVELIIKVDNVGSSPMIITPQSAGVDHYVRVNSNGTVKMTTVRAPDTVPQNFTTTSTVSSTSYSHVTFTYQSSMGGRAYFNGTQENSQTPDFVALDWTGPWVIGQRGNNSFFFNGELPMLKVYNRALSAEEIKANFNAIKGRFNI